jgi:hypothetical protein
MENRGKVTVGSILDQFLQFLLVTPFSLFYTPNPQNKIFIV